MLRWRLFGIQFTIEPSFWFMNALWAMFMFGPFTNQQDHQALIVFILVWIFCTLVSVMVHELGHVVTGRIFRQPGNITLTGLGGQAVGSYDELRPWQRILVILAGPCAGFAFVAFILLMDATAWNGFMDYLTTVSGKTFFLDYQIRTFWINDVSSTLAAWRRERYMPYYVAVSILTFINLFVNIMNLLPIIPMDGGMILKEICTLISPRQGLKVAFGISLALAIGVSLFYLELVLEKYRFLDQRITPYYPFGFPEFSLIVFLSMAYQCWHSYAQLMAAERHSLYREHD